MNFGPLAAEREYGPPRCEWISAILGALGIGGSTTAATAGTAGAATAGTAAGLGSAGATGAALGGGTAMGGGGVAGGLGANMTAAAPALSAGGSTGMGAGGLAGGLDANMTAAAAPAASSGAGMTMAAPASSAGMWTGPGGGSGPAPSDPVGGILKMIFNPGQRMNRTNPPLQSLPQTDASAGAGMGQPGPVQQAINANPLTAPSWENRPTPGLGTGTPPTLPPSKTQPGFFDRANDALDKYQPVIEAVGKLLQAGQQPQAPMQRPQFDFSLPPTQTSAPLTAADMQAFLRAFAMQG